MSGTQAGKTLGESAELARLVVRDAGRLIDQHGRLLRGELGEALREVPPAAASIGAGAGLLAIGGGLGVLMLVHGLQRATRLPLWSCYGLVGSAFAAAGASLVTRGARRASQIPLVPRESLGALREDLAWIRNAVTASPPSSET